MKSWILSYPQDWARTCVFFLRLSYRTSRSAHIDFGGKILQSTRLPTAISRDLGKDARGAGPLPHTAVVLVVEHALEVRARQRVVPQRELATQHRYRRPAPALSTGLDLCEPSSQCAGKIQAIHSAP